MTQGSDTPKPGIISGSNVKKPRIDISGAPMDDDPDITESDVRQDHSRRHEGDISRSSHTTTNNTTTNTTTASNSKPSDELTALREQNAQLIGLLKDQLSKKPEHPPAPPVPEKESRPWYRNPWIIAGGAILTIATLPYSLAVIAGGAILTIATLPYSLAVIAGGALIGGTIAAAKKIGDGISNWWKKRKEAKAAKKAEKEGTDPNPQKEKVQERSYEQEIRQMQGQIRDLEQALRDQKEGRPISQRVQDMMIEPTRHAHQNLMRHNSISSEASLLGQDSQRSAGDSMRSNKSTARTISSSSDTLRQQGSMAAEVVKSTQSTQAPNTPSFGFARSNTLRQTPSSRSK